MGTLVYSAAMTLDGYIAAPDGSVAFLDAFQDLGTDFGHQAFYDTVDALVMGFATYAVVRNMPDVPWPYAGKPCYVCTLQVQPPADANVTFVSADLHTQLAAVRAQHGRTWLVGGGQLATTLWQHGLLDEVLLHVMPTVLGTGITVFAPGAPTDTLQQLATQSYPGGVVALHYRVQQER
jgi:dihydrofolate reductase